MIDEYLAILDERKAELPEGYAAIVESAQPVRVALQRSPVKLAPSHCDPLCENFLDSGERMWIVDWEYSGMNDPLWDLGDLSVEAGFTAVQDLELMRAYCGGEPGQAELGRMVIYKAMCDLLWTLWGLIQHSDGNPAEDFWAYSSGRFERCKALMTSPDLPDICRQSTPASKKGNGAYLSPKLPSLRAKRSNLTKRSQSPGDGFVAGAPLGPAGLAKTRE